MGSVYTRIAHFARQAGHSPEVCLRTYAHLFDEYDPSDQIDPTTETEEARRAA